MRREGVTLAFLAVFIAAVQGYAFTRVFSREEQFLKYVTSAQLFLQGRLSPERTFDLSPLYLALHVAAQRIFSNPATAVQWVQFLLTTGAAVLLLQLAKRFVLFLVAAAGVIVLALSPSVLIHSHLLEPEALVLFLLTGLGYCLAGVSRLRLGLAGLALALLVLARQNFLPLILLPLLLPGDEGGWRRRLRETAIFAVPVLVVVLLLWARGAAVQRGWPPVFMNPGMVFFEGNNPLAGGQCAT